VRKIGASHCQRWLLEKPTLAVKRLEQSGNGVRGASKYYGFPESAFNKRSKSRYFRRSDYAHEKYNYLLSLCVQNFVSNSTLGLSLARVIGRRLLTGENGFDLRPLHVAF
jgi:hypothetical protein